MNFTVVVEAPPEPVPAEKEGPGEEDPLPPVGIEVGATEWLWHAEQARSEQEDGRGRGTLADPFRIRDMDAFARRHRTRAFRLDLGAGRYFSRGPWAHPDNGWCLIGYDQHLHGRYGRRQTELVVRDPVLESDGRPRDERDTYILWGGHWQGDPARKAPELHGLTLTHDCPSSVLVGGVVLYGTAPAWSDLHVGPVRGRWPDRTKPEDAGKEVFGINCQRGLGGAHGRNWWVSAVPGSYVGGCFIGFTDEQSAWSVVEDGVLDLGADNQFCLAANRRTKFRSIVGAGARSFLYNDWDITEDVELESSRGLISYAAINHVLQAISQPKRNVRASGCHFEFADIDANGTPFIGVAATLPPRHVRDGIDGARLRYDSGDPVAGFPVMGGWVVTDCHFGVPPGGTKPFYAVSSDVPTFRGLVQMSRLPEDARANLLYGATCRFMGNLSSDTMQSGVVPTPSRA